MQSYTRNKVQFKWSMRAMGHKPHHLTRKKKGKLARVDSYAAFRDENGDLCGWCFGTKTCTFRCDGISEDKTT